MLQHRNNNKRSISTRMKTALSNIAELLGEPPKIFVCVASFEDRCRAIADQLDPKQVEQVVLLENSDFDTYIAKNVSLIKARYGEKVKSIALRTDDPIFVADNLKNQVLPLIANNRGLCLIDITTFTHEQLLILIRLLAEIATPPNVKFVYVGAGEYSVNTNPNERWLSKGVTDTRAVLGYPGIMLPSRKLHLIVLVGFEHERAEKLIEKYEPALVSLGLGREHQSVRPEHYAINAEFHQRVQQFAENLSTSLAGVRRFEFSCVDPLQTMADVASEAGRFPKLNVAVCPMNTKPSTIGAALLALNDETIQLVYAQPGEYNVEGYSTIGDTCTVFDLAECFSNSAKKLRSAEPSAHKKKISRSTDLVPLIKHALVQFEEPEHPIEAHLPSTLFADVEAQGIEDAINRLLSDIMKTMTGEDARLRIEASIVDEVKVIVTITATGPISSEVASKLFEPFQKGEGSGWGLALVRSLLEANDSSLDVSSTERSSKALRVVLPAASHQDP
jgi:hypothetical protein